MASIAMPRIMNDMSQRTGVSVEALARFKKAAATSGTDIDNVAKSLGKLSKGLYEASTTGKGGAAEALDRKSTRLNSSHVSESRMPSSA